MKEDEYLMHNDIIKSFTNRLYDNIFTQDDICSSKKCIKLGNEKIYGYYMERGLEKYFVEDVHVPYLPFRITKKEEFDYKGEVINAILNVESIVIPSEKRMSFRKMVDLMPAFRHTNMSHFLLYKILSIASWIDRINARISTDAGFGKDSVVNILGALVDTTANIYGATFAKLEYHLKKELLVLNELGNLTKDAKYEMQEFLLAIGAFSNEYNKRTRKSAGTQEKYDISKTSLLIFYNLPDYYTSKGQEFFDQMFQRAVPDRLIPFMFHGRISTDFGKVIDAEKMSNEYDGLFKDLIATLNWFKNNKVGEIKYKTPEEITFSKDKGRHERSFKTILKYIGEYANSQEEFNTLASDLFKSHLEYEKVISVDKSQKTIK